MKMNKEQLSDKELDRLIDSFSQKAASPSKPFTAEESYKKFKQRLPKQPGRISLYIKYVASVAAVVIAMISGYSIYHYTSLPETLTVMTTDHVEEITLPDGSQVTLGRYSSLSYCTNLKEVARNVNLTGEAYFNVTKNENRPFIVHVKELDVKVLGTQFNVQAYDENSVVKTTLLEGAVAVSLKEGSGNMMLVPHESAVYYKESAKLQKEDAPHATDEISWMKGALVFNETPLSEIIQRLNNYYNVSLQIADEELNGYRISAKFEHEESLDDVFYLLQQAGNFHVKSGIIYSNE